MEVFVLIMGAIVMGGIAEMIRDNHFWWGFFLGPIGWIVAIVADDPRKAREARKIEEKRDLQIELLTKQIEELKKRGYE